MPEPPPGNGPLPAMLGVARTARTIARVLDAVRQHATPGRTAGELDHLARSVLVRLGAQPAMLGFRDGLAKSDAHPPFPAALSVNLNDEIMGGSDPARVLRAGDLITADLAARSAGWHADAAISWVVPGSPNDPALAERRAALAAASAAVTRAGVAAILPGRPWSEVTKAMAAQADRLAVTIWPGYHGHGVGRSMHQPPRLPSCPADRPDLQAVILQPGTAVTVEPTIGWAGPRTESVRSNWLERTADASDACFTEVTVVVGARRAAATGLGS